MAPAERAVAGPTGRIGVWRGVVPAGLCRNGPGARSLDADRIPGHPRGDSGDHAALVGAGAALTLDEFALWFNLDDVYWTKTGRQSIDAILIGSAPGAVLLLEASPVGASLLTPAR